MNLSRHQSPVCHIASIAGPRAAVALMVFGIALAASNPAMAQALEPVVRGATIARDTIVAITLLLMTVGAWHGQPPRRLHVAGQNRPPIRAHRQSLCGLLATHPDRTGS